MEDEGEEMAAGRTVPGTGFSYFGMEIPSHFLGPNKGRDGVKVV